MKNIFMPLMAAAMLVPSMTLASSIRPGSRVTHESLNSGSSSRSKSPLCLGENERFTEKCDIVIDETGVKGPAGVGMAAGLGSCMIVGPLCLFTAPAIMTSGATGGAGLGGKGTGKYFTVIGDDKDGNRLIQEFYVRSGKAVRNTSRNLLLKTGLAEGEVKG